MNFTIDFTSASRKFKEVPHNPFGKYLAHEHNPRLSLRLGSQCSFLILSVRLEQNWKLLHGSMRRSRSRVAWQCILRRRNLSQFVTQLSLLYALYTPFVGRHCDFHGRDVSQDILLRSVTWHLELLGSADFVFVFECQVEPRQNDPWAVPVHEELGNPQGTGAYPPCPT